MPHARIGGSYFDGLAVMVRLLEHLEEERRCCDEKTGASTETAAVM